MSILVRFPSGRVTREMYDETIRRADELGEFPPDGLEYHVAFMSADGDVRVSEIWDSREQMQAFGERLMPWLAEMGINLTGEPEILEVHNIIKR
jgi:hypothetical protein